MPKPECAINCASVIDSVLFFPQMLAMDDFSYTFVKEIPMSMTTGPFVATWTDITTSLSRVSLFNTTFQLMTVLLTSATRTSKVIFDHRSWDPNTMTFKNFSVGSTNLNFVQWMQVSNMNGTYHITEENRYIYNKAAPFANGTGVGAYSPWGDANSDLKFTFYARMISSTTTAAVTTTPRPTTTTTPLPTTTTAAVTTTPRPTTTTTPLPATTTAAVTTTPRPTTTTTPLPTTTTTAVTTTPRPTTTTTVGTTTTTPIPLTTPVYTNTMTPAPEMVSHASCHV
jgi:hypothetical protein